jgi:hypothetical protein
VALLTPLYCPNASACAHARRCQTLQAANLSIPDDAAWTIFAPNNEAFNDSSVRWASTNLTAVQLLEPANKAALAKVCTGREARDRVVFCCCHHGSARTVQQQLHTMCAHASGMPCVYQVNVQQRAAQLRRLD